MQEVKTMGLSYRVALYCCEAQRGHYGGMRNMNGVRCYNNEFPCTM